MVRDWQQEADLMEEEVSPDKKYETSVFGELEFQEALSTYHCIPH